MKVISISQPFASLKVKGFKIFETRTWPAPKSYVGKPMGIASTKSIRPVGHEYYADEKFQGYYARTGMPPIEELPSGFLLGYGTLDSVELMTPDFMDDVSDEEKAYGFWQEGFYAWRFTQMVELPHPIPIRGAQGIYDWNGDLNAPESSSIKDEAGREDQEGPASLRRHLRLV